MHANAHFPLPQTTRAGTHSRRTRALRPLPHLDKGVVARCTLHYTYSQVPSNRDGPDKAGRRSEAPSLPKVSWFTQRQVLRAGIRQDSVRRVVVCDELRVSGGRKYRLFW